MKLRRSWLFLVPLLLLSTAAVADDAKDKKKAKVENLVAQIKLSGGLADAPAAMELPFGGGGSGTLPDMIERFKKAKKDDNVKALYLHFDGLGISWGKLHELRTALLDFKKSGKKTYAYLEQAGQMDYLLAASCDEIIVPPVGGIELPGLRYEMTYMKDLLDRFDVKYDVVAIGDFKSAMENFARSSMSPANRKQWEELADDYYAILTQTLASSRGFSEEEARRLIDKGIFTAKEAVAAKLADRIAYESDLLPHFKKAIGNDQLTIKSGYGKKKQEDLDLGNPFAILKLLAPPKDAKVSAKPKVTVIYAEGAIVTGKGGPSLFGGNQVGSTTLVEAIKKAEDEPTVKAIVLRVDSPGGSALASDLIWHELKKSKKPVIASMGDVAASGGYYISMAAKKIYAEPGTITGSIGVVGGKLVLGGAMNKFGINSEVISRGKMSGLSTMDRDFNTEERAAIVGMMTDIYDEFLNKSFDGRKQAGNTKITSVEELRKLAGGRIWSGNAAKANGLIDELGTLDDAIAAAKAMAKLTADEDVELMVLPRPRSFFETLMESESGVETLLGQAEMRALTRVPGLRKPLQLLELLHQQRQEKVWLLSPVQFLNDR